MKFARDDSVHTTTYVVEGMDGLVVDIRETPTAIDVILRDSTDFELSVPLFTVQRPKSDMTQAKLLIVVDELLTVLLRGAIEKRLLFRQLWQDRMGLCI